jgi:D-alanine-D-alanine ligase
MVRQFGVSKDGKWLVGNGAWNELYLDSDDSLLPATIRDFPSAAVIQEVSRHDCFPDSRAFNGLDCLFPLVHGVGGEDGSIRGFLELTRLPIAGCSLLGCAQSYNKWTARRLSRDAGIPTVATIFVPAGEDPMQSGERVCSEFGTWDAIVKPVSSGSSFGVSRITAPEHLVHALEEARRYSADCLVEAFTPHRELFVALMGTGSNVIVSDPAMSPIMRSGLSTYHDKYIADEPPLRCPSGLSVSIDQCAREIALAAYETLGCSGFARVDLFACLSTDRVWLNEVNAVPALAADCAFAAGMNKAGYSYPDLLAAIIGQSLRAAQPCPSLDRRQALPQL